MSRHRARSRWSLVLVGVVGAIVALLLFLAIAPRASADTAADLASIQGDGASIADYENYVYSSATTANACDAICGTLNNNLTNAAQTGITDDATAAASGEAMGLAEQLGWGALDIATPVGAAVGAGYILYKLGSTLFGSDSAPASNATFNPYSGGADPVFVDYGACVGQADCHNVTQANTSGYTGTPAHYIVNNAFNSRSGQYADLLQNHYVGFFLVAAGGVGATDAQHLPPGWFPYPEGSFGLNGFNYVAHRVSFSSTNPNTGQPWTGTPTVTPQPMPTQNDGGAAALNYLNGNPNAYPNLIHSIASAAATAPKTIPANICQGMTGPACAAALNAIGLPNTTVVKDTFATANAAQPANAALYLEVSPSVDPHEYPLIPDLPAPIPGVTPSAPIRIEENPDQQDMPVAVPAPEPWETADAYKKRLALLGLVGLIIILDPTTLDPSHGPNEVTNVSPSPGTNLPWQDVNASPLPAPSVNVYQNPANAPTPAGDPNGSPTPGPPQTPTPAIDLGPIKNLHIGCTTFPFGVFCWLGSALGGWGAQSASCPSIDVPIHGDNLGFNFCQFNPAMDIIRPIIGIVSFFGIAWLLSASALGFGSGESSED